MYYHEFVQIQDTILQLSGREMATALGVDPAAITKWRKAPNEGGRDIPDYIERLLHHLVKEKLGTISFPLTSADINGIIRLAAARGLSFEGLVVDILRTAIKADTLKQITSPTPSPSPIIHRDIKPAGITYHPSEEETKASRLNEES